MGFNSAFKGLNNYTRIENMDGEVAVVYIEETPVNN